MQTRAAVAHKAGAPLTIETVDLDGPKAGEVLVEIKATGICHTDEFTLSGADPDPDVSPGPDVPALVSEVEAEEVIDHVLQALVPVAEDLGL